jgi:hypothetical protein
LTFAWFIFHLHFTTFKLYPDIISVKQQIKTFETQTDESPARNQFRKLHAISAILNILLLIDGSALIILNNTSKKQEIQHSRDWKGIVQK